MIESVAFYRETSATKLKCLRVAKLPVPPWRIQPPASGPFRLRIGGALQPREEGFVGIDSRKTDSVRL